jgi:hypothetical protein
MVPSLVFDKDGKLIVANNEWTVLLPMFGGKLSVFCSKELESCILMSFARIGPVGRLTCCVKEYAHILL